MQSWSRDPFLEACLGYPVLRLLEVGALEEATSSLGGARDWMIAARVPVERANEAEALTRRGFLLVDTNVQLVRPAGPMEQSSSARCRFAAAGDEAAVRRIAASSFTQTRFHCDSRIPRSAADRIKEEWAANYFAGRRGEWMVVAEDGSGGIGGFLQLLRGPGDSLVIDLIAVDPRTRRGGLASAMIAFARTACGVGGALQVGTQIANYASLSLYGRLGFRISSAAYVFHLHGADSRR